MAYTYHFPPSSEVLGSSPQSVLLAYLRVVLTEWAESEAWLDRAASLLGLITNTQLIHELLASILSSKVQYVHFWARIIYIVGHCHFLNSYAWILCTIFAQIMAGVK